MADGARPDVLCQELNRGNLPNLARYLVEGGTFETILTAFPSTTGPAYLPYLTGCYPGTCNVPGIRWFDRAHYARHGWSFKSFRSYVGLETTLFNRDIKEEIQTAFSIYKNPVNILNNIFRGIPAGNNKTQHSRIWYIYYAHLTDHWSFVDSAVTKKIINSLDQDPDFIFAVFPSIDEYSHRSSVFNPRVIQAYRDIDGHIGEVIAALKKKGWLEETLLVVVSDHGLSDTHTHFDVGPYLEEKGMKTFFYTQIFKRNFKGATMVSGNGMCHVYLKHPDGWQRPCYYEDLTENGFLLEEFRNRPEIGLVACRGVDGSIHLLTSRGQGKFKVNNGKIDYQFDRYDPLNLCLKTYSLIMTIEESLDITLNSHFPDVFVQLDQIFSSPRSGDIILSANPGYDLRKRYEHPEHKASHGSLCPEHMKTPFLMSTRMIRKPKRSVDIFPTILELTGKKIPPSIDGRSLFIL